MSSYSLQSIPEDLLHSIFSFGAIWDHANLEQTNKYINDHLITHYQRQTHFNFIHHWISHNKIIDNKAYINTTFAQWISIHFLNVKHLILNAEITENDLMILLDKKLKLKYLSISPIYHHNKISHAFISNIKDLCPNIERLQMIACNWNLKHFNRYEMLYSLISQIEENKYFDIQRLPEWFIGDWICFEDNAISRGEIHCYSGNGLFHYERDDQNKGVVTHLEYCKNYNLFSKTATIKLIYWIPDWPLSVFGPVSLIVRSYNVSNHQLNEINDDDEIQNAIHKLYGNKLKTTKYHWESMEVAQNTARDIGGILEKWPDNMQDIRHYGIWVKLVFHE